MYVSLEFTSKAAFKFFDKTVMHSIIQSLTFKKTHFFEFTDSLYTFIVTFYMRNNIVNNSK